MRHTFFILTLGTLLAASALQAQTAPFSKGGATQQTPSKSEYFSWIDHTWEGSTEEQTLANLNFFKWMKDTYGMQLDKKMAGAQFDAVVMSVAEEEGCDNLDIKVYMSLYPWDKGGNMVKIKE